MPAPALATRAVGLAGHVGGQRHGVRADGRIATIPAMPHALSSLSLVAIVLGAAPIAVEARQQGKLLIDVTAGWVGFADDGIVSEAFAGGSARWRLRPRISIGPELIYIQGDNHRHLVATGNLTFDFKPDGPVEPFLIVGGGMFQTRETFFDDAVTSSEGTFTAGGGVRAHVTDRVTFGVDARIGWEAHFRIGGLVSIRLR